MSTKADVKNIRYSHITMKQSKCTAAEYLRPGDSTHKTWIIYLNELSKPLHLFTLHFATFEIEAKATHKLGIHN